MKLSVEVLWLVQIFRLEAIVFWDNSWSPWAKVWRDHVTNELYVFERKDKFEE